MFNVAVVLELDKLLHTSHEGVVVPRVFRDVVQVGLLRVPQVRETCELVTWL